MRTFDAIVLGAGAAGLHCAAIAGQRGLDVLLLDHAERVAEKIRISGGGRCNFTNTGTGAAHFDSANPDFCRSALARYTPRDFIALVERHRIAWHEKHKGQLFCNDSSARIIDMLLKECERGGVTRWQPCSVAEVRSASVGFELETSAGRVGAAQVVVATGGLSIPKIGATDFGHRLARQFGHRVVETRPALVPLTLPSSEWGPFAAMSGVSLPVRIATGAGQSRIRFDEDLLITHRGLSGPAALQISTYWHLGEEIRIDCAPDRDIAGLLRAAKRDSRRRPAAALSDELPRRFAETWVGAQGKDFERPLADLRDRHLAELAENLHAWRLRPEGTEGYRKAEVTAGGVDTQDLDSRTLQSRRCPGLYFIGEVLDVTGWLGGYNFQWAWASAVACATALARRPAANVQ